MTTGIGAWAIDGDDRPERLRPDTDYLEKHLETWIENDPSLIAPGISWVARQLVLPDRSRLDLLGLTRDGTWVITELKYGSVDNGTVVQAMHYFLELACMSGEELLGRLRGQGKLRPEHESAVVDSLSLGDSREHMIVVAGVGTGERAEAAATALANAGFEVPVRVVTFQLVRDGGGRRVLIREVDDDHAEGTAVQPAWSWDALLESATNPEVRDGLRQIHDDLTRAGFHSALRKRGLNYNEGTRRQTFWIQIDGDQLRVGALTRNFPSLYGVDEATADADIDRNWSSLPPDEARALVARWTETIVGYRTRRWQQAEAGIDQA